MELKQVISLSYEEIIQYILDSRGLSKHPPPVGEVWKILPTQVVELLGCIRVRDAQVGDFIIPRVSRVERDWTNAVEQLGGGDWIPILIGSTEVGEGIVISYNRIGNYCIEPINLVKDGLFMQGEVIALNFDTFLRINLILDAIKSEDLFEEGVLNSEGQQRLLEALKVFYPNFSKSDYWNSWLG